MNSKISGKRILRAFKKTLTRVRSGVRSNKTVKQRSPRVQVLIDNALAAVRKKVRSRWSNMSTAMHFDWIQWLSTLYRRSHRAPSKRKHRLWDAMCRKVSGENFPTCEDVLWFQIGKRSHTQTLLHFGNSNEAATTEPHNKSTNSVMWTMVQLANGA